jgi:uncharacterized protein (TIGR02594 family)
LNTEAVVTAVSDVRKIQARLNELGYKSVDGGPLVVDGVLGRNTTAAIAAFQKDRDLPIRFPGTIGPITLNALELSGKIASVPPPWVLEARRHLGLHEVRDAKKLDRMLRMDTSEIPWCGGFQGMTLATALPREPLPANPLWARNWLKLGRSVPKDQPALGDVAVFERGSGGHVGTVVGHDATALHILGGNQSNAVTVARVGKNRLLGLRWPLTGGDRGAPLPRTTIAGTLSKNEA